MIRKTAGMSSGGVIISTVPCVRASALFIVVFADAHTQPVDICVICNQFFFLLRNIPVLKMEMSLLDDFDGFEFDDGDPSSDVRDLRKRVDWLERKKAELFTESESEPAVRPHFQQIIERLVHAKKALADAERRDAEEKQRLAGVFAESLFADLSTTTMPTLLSSSAWAMREIELAVARESGAAEARAEAAREVARTTRTDKLLAARDKLKLVQFEWNYNAQKGKTTETESDIKERLSTIADGIAREWAFGPTGNGPIRPLRDLLSEIHMLLPEADGWMPSSSSTDSSICRSLETAKNSGDVDWIFKQIILHIHPDKTASEDSWSRLLKESIFKRLNESRGALESE
jgi:hypothetical protein